MSKTKAGGCGGREVDIHLRIERVDLQLLLTSRTFVTGMEEIIKKSAGHLIMHSSPALK